MSVLTELLIAIVKHASMKECIATDVEKPWLLYHTNESIIHSLVSRVHFGMHVQKVLRKLLQCACHTSLWTVWLHV